MITLIHGDDTAASRDYYFSLRQKTNVPSLDGIALSLTDLQQQTSGSDLFGNTSHVFIENLLSKKKNAKEMEDFIALLNNTAADVILWESKELTQAQVKLFKKVQVKSFKIPAAVFALLDNLKPGNGKHLIDLFHQTLQDKDPEFVLVMLQRQIRILLALQSKSEKNISEITRMAPWQLGKLQKQSLLFITEELISLHSKLFYLELGMKTGSITQPLENEIDILLLKF